MNQISKTHLNALRATVAMPPMSASALEPVAGDETEILAPDGQEQAIGERLAQARKAAKLSRTAVAKIIGRRGAQVVTDYETGTSKVRLSTVREIAAATGADVTWLWLGREPLRQEQIGTGPDAALIALCARHDALLSRANVDSGLPGEQEDERITGLVVQARDLAKIIANMRATSSAGIVALARTTATAADGLLIDNDTDPLLKMLFRDSLALEAAQSVPTIGSSPAAGPSAEITAAISAVVAARVACDHVDATTPGDEEACDATATVHSEALDACGSVRIATLADASAIARLALRYLAADDITGQADVITRGLLESLAAIPNTGVRTDAELLSLHDRFINLEANSRSLQRTIPNDGARAIAQEPITAEQNTILSSAWELTATTLDGHRARARMLLAWDSELKNGAIEGHGPDAEMAWMLVRDLVGEDHADALQSCDLDVYRQAAGAWQSGAAIGTSSDTDLIAACAAFDALEQQSLATFTGEDMTPDEEEMADAERERIQHAQEPHFDRIMALRAATSAGLRAKVRSLTVENPDLLGSGSGDRRQCLIASICKDVLGGGVSIDTPPDVTVTDAPVLALIAEARRLRAGVDAFAWSKVTDAAFQELCIRAETAVLAVATANTTSPAGLRAVAQLLLEEQTHGGGSEGFDHSVAENGALALLKRLAADPEPSDPDAGIIALCHQVAAAWAEYRRLGIEEDALPAAEQDAFDKASRSPAYDRACFLYEAVQRSPVPKTAEGLRAVARAAVCRADASRPEDAHVIEMTDPGAELAWKLVGHLAGLEVQSMMQAGA